MLFDNSELGQILALHSVVIRFQKWKSKQNKRIESVARSFKNTYKSLIKRLCLLLNKLFLF